MNKLFLAFGLLMVTANSFASVTRGYVAENGGIQFYSGLDASNRDVQLPLFSFSRAQVTSMMGCMKKRETHAIQVVSREVARPVPTDIPGHSTSFHDTVIESVKCVKAPNYLYFWRTKFQR